VTDPVTFQKKNKYFSKKAKKLVKENLWGHPVKLFSVQISDLTGLYPDTWDYVHIEGAASWRAAINWQGSGSSFSRSFHPGRENPFPIYPGL
jgi:hypothetical protein